MECDEEDDDVNVKENQSRYSLKEVRGDLFSSPASHSLAHCVSRDFKLGKGVARLFRDKFGRVEELEDYSVEVTKAHESWLGQPGYTPDIHYPKMLVLTK